MRWTFFVAATLLCSPATLAMLPAQQPDPTPPPPAPLPSADQVEYGANVLYAIQFIEQAYVRPVSRADLLVEALRALYAASGEPPPNSLDGEIRKAKKDDEVRSLLDRTRRRPEIAKRLSEGEASVVSCRAMLRVLDPHCEILVGDQVHRSSGRLDNNGVGIDLEDNHGGGPVRIKEVHPGGPGQKAGLRPGDRITAIDRKPLEKVDSTEALRMLNAGRNFQFQTNMSFFDLPNVAPVQICYERLGQSKPAQAMLEAKEFSAETIFGVQRREDNSWHYWIDRPGKIAHVRIGALTRDTIDDLLTVLIRLREGGMRGLLLDLRWCPGGLLDQSVKISSEFLGECRIASIRGRGGKEAGELESKEKGHCLDIPIIVLVNGETSGGGELIAAALQDHQRAAICGQRTRGKASIQTMHALPMNGTYLKLTSSIFIRPNGKNLNRFPDNSPKDEWGVRPDSGLEIRVSAKLNQQLREWWLLQTLRPGPSRERLPLDDPSADPQRQFALQALRDRIK
jgi:C-terminal peptidase prc